MKQKIIKEKKIRGNRKIMTYERKKWRRSRILYENDEGKNEYVCMYI